MISATGEVGAVSVVRTPLEDMEAVENGIKIRREYFKSFNLPAFQKIIPRAFANIQQLAELLNI